MKRKIKPYDGFPFQSAPQPMIAGINAGVVQVNAMGPIDNVAPFGGVKQSGNGVDKSLHAFDKYLDFKTAWVHL